jgi:hypothetical protein
MKKLFTLAMMLLMAGNTLQAQIIVNDKDKDKDKNKSGRQARQVVMKMTTMMTTTGVTEKAKQ